MQGNKESGYRYSKGGLFRRLVFALVLLTLAAGLLSVYFARRHEMERERSRLVSVASSNVQLFERLSLPLSGRLANDLSSAAGVTIVFADHQGRLVSPAALDRAHTELVMQALDAPEQVIERNNHHAVALSIPGSPETRLVAMEPAPTWGFLDKSAVTPALLVNLLLAIGVAFIVSRSAVIPLGKMARAIRDTPSDRKLSLPASLLRQRDEIGILSRELESSRQQLIAEQGKRRQAERLAMLGQLTTSLAHEIKNPAAGIIMHSQALEKQEQNPAGPLIREEAEQIVSLVDQWLYVAKPSGTRRSMNSLADILDRLLEKLEPHLEYHSVTVEKNIPSPANLRCDAQRLELVFRNLITNSIHAMPEGGKITLMVSDSGHGIDFSVSDQGPGFSPGAISHFGEAFYSEREGGIGLGLTLVKEVVKSHGGRVEASNPPEGGALVSGWLPTQTASPNNCHESKEHSDR